MSERELDTLFDLAAAAREHAHAPYSNFKVGAAILTDDGRAFAGCNVENIAYPQGACAETGAIGAMVAGGGKRIARVVVLGGKDALIPCAPCGGCRQRLLEFAGPQTEVWLGTARDSLKRYTLAELLPLAFDSLTDAPKA